MVPEFNKANRRVCDVYIDILKTGKPFLYLDTANVTTQNISSDSVYALSRGQKSIAWQESANGTMTIEAQVLPFKIYAMISDGVIYNDAVFPKHETIKAETDGKLTLSDEPKDNVVFVFKHNDFGGVGIEGTVSNTDFTANKISDISIGAKYEVGYYVAKTTGVNRVSFGEKFNVQDYRITMSTLLKDESGAITPYFMKAYKAVPQRNFELSQASTGDPASITITFDILRDKNGNYFDIVEDTGIARVPLEVSDGLLKVRQGILKVIKRMRL